MTTQLSKEEILKAMDANEQLVTQRLYDLFLPLYEGVDVEIKNEISWHQRRGNTIETAMPKIRDKYLSLLENSEHITCIIVDYKNIWESPDDFDDISFLDYLATEFSKSVSLLYKSLTSQLVRVEEVNSTHKLLSVKETACFLRLTVPTVYSKVSRGELPAMKQGNRLNFSLSELLQSGKKKSNTEIQAEAEAYLKGRKEVHRG